MTKGFTLIELLVVVLIIGILTSFALPYYENAVDQARFSEVKPIVKTIKDAVEVASWSSGNGYPAGWDSLDMQMPVSCSDGSSSADPAGLSVCKNICVDLYDGANQNIVGYNAKNIAEANNAYAYWLKDSAHPNRIECWAKPNNPRAAKLCDVQGGVLAGKSSGSGCPTCDVYILP